jgi:hypothetical protein
VKPVSQGSARLLAGQVKDEAEGIRVYGKLAEGAGSAREREVFRGILKDEKRHLRELTDLEKGRPVKLLTKNGEEVIARKYGRRILINPEVPRRIGNIDVYKRLRVHERVYWQKRDEGCSHDEAKRLALEAEHEGLSQEQIARYEGTLGHVLRT